MQKVIDSEYIWYWLTVYQGLGIGLRTKIHGLNYNKFLSTQEHRTEIDARAGTFQAFELFGHQLLQSGHFASAEVQEKLEAMNRAREELER